MRIPAAIAVLSLSLAPVAVRAADDGNPDAGLAYAREVCSGCHAVEKGQTVSINIKAPPFDTIATSKLITSREIVGWLQSSHPDMPDLMVPPDKRADVVAYLTRFKPKT